MAVWSVVNFLQLPYDFRIDSEYFQPKYLEVEFKLSQLKCNFLESLATNIRTGPFGSNLLKETYTDDGVIVLRPFNIKEISCEIENLVYIPLEDVERQRLNLYNPGDLAFARVGDIRCGVIPDYGKPITISPNVIVASLDTDKINPYFLAVFMNTKLGFLQMERAMKVVAQPTITVETIKSILIPEIPLEDQLKIANFFELSVRQREKANSLYAEAEALLLHELGLDTLDLSTQKTYITNFSETVEGDRFDAEYFQPKYKKVVQHLSTTCITKSLSELGQVTKGRSANYSDSGVPVIRSGDLTDLDNLGELKQADPNQGLFYLEKGDICISSIGFGSIGKVQLFDKDGKYATVSEVTVIRQKQVNPYFLQIFLQSLAGQLQIEKYITGATGQLHLYPRDVSKIVIPIISKDKQKEFERLIMEARQVKQETKDLLEQAKHRVEQMILGERATDEYPS